MCSVPGLPPISLSILSIRSSIAFASCTSWTNFRDDLSTRKERVVQSLGREHYFLEEGVGGRRLGNFLEPPSPITLGARGFFFSLGATELSSTTRSDAPRRRRARRPLASRVISHISLSQLLCAYLSISRTVFNPG